MILLHGSHGTRLDTAGHLRALARVGLAVLAFDARGHGASAGQTNALGWEGTSDAAGAVAFLGRQAGVDENRIGALGLSMGAEEALRAASDGVPLGAVVADGAGASTLGDQQLVSHGVTEPIASSATWLSMRGIELLTGAREPPPLADIVHRIHVPVLLIASRSGDELALDRAFRTRIGPRAHLWYLADTGHTRGLATHARAYADRVTGFLSAALAPRTPGPNDGSHAVVARVRG